MLYVYKYNFDYIQHKIKIMGSYFNIKNIDEKDYKEEFSNLKLWKRYFKVNSILMNKRRLNKK